MKTVRGAPGSASVSPANSAGDATYTVKRGDTLYLIALDHGLDYRELAAWNHIQNVDRIYAGQVLQLRAPGAVVAAASAAATPQVTGTASDAGAQPGPGVTVTPLRSEPPIVAASVPVPGGAPATVSAGITGSPATATTAAAASTPGSIGPAATTPGTQGTLETEPRAIKLPYSDQAVRELNLAASAAPAPSSAGGGTGPAPGAPGASAPSAASAPPSPSTVASAAPSSSAAVSAGPSSGAPASSTGGASAGDDRLGWVWPAKGKVIAQFSDSANLKGIDIAGAMGEPVYASAAGKVVYAGSGLRGYGKLIIIKHNAMYLSAYAHNSAILVKEGQQVTRGQEIAQMGSTDSDQVKLHFEIRRYGKPMDPEKFLPPA